jgi:hypothetical protein
MNTFKILFVISKGRIPHGRLRHRWEDRSNVKMDLTVAGCEDVD